MALHYFKQIIREIQVLAWTQQHSLQVGGDMHFYVNFYCPRNQLTALGSGVSFSSTLACEGIRASLASTAVIGAIANND